MSLKNKLFEFDKKKMATCASSKEIVSGDNQCQQLSPIILIGTDEAGRGPGAGGVFASAVYFNALNDELIDQLSKLNDSKKLSKKAREELFEIIIKTTINSTVCIEVEEIEDINILNASLKAMKLACENVINEVNSSDVIARQTAAPPRKDSTEASSPKTDDFFVLVDGNKLIKQFEYPQEFVIKGDSKSASIAAASILAKVSRDKYMDELDANFPQYNWKKNAGYLTKQHLAAIDEFGITPHHRQKFLRKHFAKSEQLELTL